MRPGASRSGWCARRWFTGRALPVRRAAPEPPGTGHGAGMPAPAGLLESAFRHVPESRGGDHMIGKPRADELRKECLAHGVRGDKG